MEKGHVTTKARGIAPLVPSVYTPLFFIIILALELVCSYRVTLTDNGYSGIVVGLDDDIDQIHETTLINNIQEMFTDASAFLYEATWHRAYFREVTILLPETWKRKNGTGVAGRETYDSAHIRVTHPNPSYYGKSHTLQASTICGEPGLYVHINVDHLINPTSTQNLLEYGPPGRWLTRYWSHYRYGIFDEHGYLFNETFPPLYGEEYLVTSCVKETAELINGNLVNITNISNPACDFAQNTLHCIYYPDPVKDKVYSSIAYNHSLPTVTHFCDDTDEYRHNADAPTPQNAYCDKRSTWDVISQHPDFQNRNARGDVADTRPSFRVVAPSEDLNIVLLFDLSASVGKEELDLFRRVSASFLSTSVPQGSVVGSVAFNKCAFQLKNMTKLLSSSNIQDWLPPSSQRTDCSTCIGCGIEVALHMLAENGISAGAILIILTDGRENTAPPIKEALHDVFQAGVRVFTIVYGNVTDGKEEFEDLAEVSHGQTFFLSPETTTVSHITDIMASAIASRIRSIKVMTQDYSYHSRNDLKGSFVLDASSTTTVSFVTTYDIPRSLMQVSVWGPYQSGSPPVLKASALSNVFSFVINKPQKGLWRYRLRMTSNQQKIGVSVSASHSRESPADPINTNGWINVNNMKINATTPVAFFAKVHQKEKPILNARVFACVILPNGQVKSLRLLDNGVEPDLHANDGLYSRYFIEFDGKGRYDVKYDISNQHRRACNSYQNDTRTKALLMESRDIQQQFTFSSVARFQRSILVGSFTVLDDFYYADNDDIIPPNTIYDLKIVQVAEDLSHVTLEWTAPGDDYDRGIATSYEVKYSRDSLNMTEATFGQNPHELSSNDVMNGSLKPLPAGKRQQVILRFREDQESVVHPYFLSIRAVDDARNAAKPSNFVQIFDSTPLEKCKHAGILLPHPKAYGLYLKCEATGRLPIRMRCPPGKLFSSRLSLCTAATSVNAAAVNQRNLF